MVVCAKTGEGSRGITAFMIENGMEGFSIGQKVDKLGIRGSPTAELVFDECRVPAANRVGAENAGVSVVMSGLDLERAIVSMINLGMAERAFALALDYAKTREQFGKKIGSFQLVQAKLADMYTTIETIRTYCYRTLAEANDMEVGGGGRGDIHKLTASCILYAAEGCTKVITDAVQIFGGAGYMRESEINRLYRATKLLEIGAGTSERIAHWTPLEREEAFTWILSDSGRQSLAGRPAAGGGLRLHRGPGLGSCQGGAGRLHRRAAGRRLGRLQAADRQTGCRPG